MAILHCLQKQACLAILRSFLCEAGNMRQPHSQTHISYSSCSGVPGCIPEDATKGENSMAFSCLALSAQPPRSSCN